MTTQEQLIKRWIAAGITPPLGVHTESLREFERHNHIVFPEDMRRFYRQVDGLPKGVMDPITNIRIWSLTEISASEPTSMLFEFADYLIDSHRYAIDLSDADTSGRISLVGDGVQVVASSFAEFLESLNNNARRLYASVGL